MSSNYGYSDLGTQVDYQQQTDTRADYHQQQYFGTDTTIFTNSSDNVYVFEQTSRRRVHHTGVHNNRGRNGNVNSGFSIGDCAGDGDDCIILNSGGDEERSPITSMFCELCDEGVTIPCTADEPCCAHGNCDEACEGTAPRGVPPTNQFNGVRESYQQYSVGQETQIRNVNITSGNDTRQAFEEPMEYNDFPMNGNERYYSDQSSCTSEESIYDSGVQKNQVIQSFQNVSDKHYRTGLDNVFVCECRRCYISEHTTSPNTSPDFHDSAVNKNNSTENGISTYNNQNDRAASCPPVVEFNNRENSEFGCPSVYYCQRKDNCSSGELNSSRESRTFRDPQNKRSVHPQQKSFSRFGRGPFVHRDRQDQCRIGRHCRYEPYTKHHFNDANVRSRCHGHSSSRSHRRSHSPMVCDSIGHIGKHRKFCHKRCQLKNSSHDCLGSDGSTDNQGLANESHKKCGSYGHYGNHGKNKFSKWHHGGQHGAPWDQRGPHCHHGGSRDPHCRHCGPHWHHGGPHGTPWHLGGLHWHHGKPHWRHEGPLWHRKGPHWHRGGPHWHRGGPHLHRGGPHLHRGGPHWHGSGPHWHHGGPHWHHGGPHWHHGGPHWHHGGPHWHHGGPHWHHGGHHWHQGGPHWHHGGPHWHHGGPHWHHGGPLWNHGGSQWNHGGPHGHHKGPQWHNEGPQWYIEGHQWHHERHQRHHEGPQWHHGETQWHSGGHRGYHYHGEPPWHDEGPSLYGSHGNQESHCHRGSHHHRGLHGRHGRHHHRRIHVPCSSNGSYANPGSFVHNGYRFEEGPYSHDEYCDYEQYDGDRLCHSAPHKFYEGYHHFGPHNSLGTTDHHKYFSCHERNDQFLKHKDLSCKNYGWRPWVWHRHQKCGRHGKLSCCGRGRHCGKGGGRGDGGGGRGCHFACHAKQTSDCECNFCAESRQRCIVDIGGGRERNPRPQSCPPALHHLNH